MQARAESIANAAYKRLLEHTRNESVQLALRHAHELSEVSQDPPENITFVVRLGRIKAQDDYQVAKFAAETLFKKFCDVSIYSEEPVIAGYMDVSTEKDLTIFTLDLMKRPG